VSDQLFAALIKESGLHMTRRWREKDSNPRSPLPKDDSCRDSPERGVDIMKARLALLSTRRTGHRYGVPRMVRGVARSLFLAQQDDLLAEPEIDSSAAAMFSPLREQGLALTAAKSACLFSPIVTDRPDTGSSRTSDGWRYASKRVIYDTSRVQTCLLPRSESFVSVVSMHDPTVPAHAQWRRWRERIRTVGPCREGAGPMSRKGNCGIVEHGLSQNA
jgi:hypothetical protein